MKMKLFKYGYLIRHAFDLGRIFPIIIKQRDLANLTTGISSHAFETLKFLLLTIDLHLKNMFLGTIPNWISETWLHKLSAMI